MSAQTAPSILDPLSNFLSSLNQPDQAHSGPMEVLFALLLSFGLNCLIAKVYKSTYRGTKYSQDYVHTLLILGTVVTMVIMVVSGNQATAFGMFAAFSIIRFRRSVSQSRDIGFIFFAMATGLAVGARAYMLAAITTPIICTLMVWITRRDAFAPQRLSHRLRIRASNDLDYDRAFPELFAQYLSYHHLDSVETIQAGLMTELRFSITLSDQSKLGAFVAGLQQLNGNERILVTAAVDSASGS